MSYTVDPTRCPQNHTCPLVTTCPVQAITQVGFALPQIDPQVCVACGECEAKCGKQAIYMRN